MNKETSASDSSKIPKCAKNEYEKIKDSNHQKVRTDETLSVTAVNQDEVTEEDCKHNKIVDNLPSTAISSMVSCEAAIPQDNTFVISNEKQPSTSGLEHDKAKSMSKGQLTGDSGISMDKSENSSDDDSNKCQKLTSSLGNKKTTDKNTEDTDSAKFRKLKSEVKKRNYRSRKTLRSESGDNVTETPSDEQHTKEGTSSQDNEESIDRLKRCDSSDLSNHSEEDKASDDDFDGEDEDDDDSFSDKKEEKYLYKKDRFVLPCLRMEKPKHRWIMVPEIMRREIGNNSLFRRKFYGSLHAVERLELMYKLKDHESCVNTINFNQKGNLLASGGDDLAVIIWDWAIGKKYMSFNSGHSGNLFQTKWLPFDVEHLIVTSDQDGEVRLLDISHGTSRMLATHEDAVHELTVHKDSPQIIMSAGLDAYVLIIDIRQNKPTKFLVTSDIGIERNMYTIHSNPLNSNEFCVGGDDHIVRVFDRRKLSKPLNMFYPAHLENKLVDVTSAVYNYNGTEILASYENDDIYIFDASNQNHGTFAHRYRGHKNSSTIKGVNFFGPKSEFICSGSDCGNIFVWEKNTEAIVQWMPGDENGVVNCLEPHPHVPILATSGLDYDVKIWVPSCEQAPSMTGLESVSVLSSSRRVLDCQPDFLSLQLRSLDLKDVERAEQRFEAEVRSDEEMRERGEDKRRKWRLRQKTEENLETISLDQVSWHDTPDDCWIVIYDYVYDCTKFLDAHPGGRDVLVEYAGRDATLAFIGTGHSKTARKSLEMYLIGELPAEERIFRVQGGLNVLGI